MNAETIDALVEAVYRQLELRQQDRWRLLASGREAEAFAVEDSIATEMNALGHTLAGDAPAYRKCEMLGIAPCEFSSIDIEKHWQEISARVYRRSDDVIAKLRSGEMDAEKWLREGSQTRSLLSDMIVKAEANPTKNLTMLETMSEWVGKNRIATGFGVVAAVALGCVMLNQNRSQHEAPQRA